MRNYFLIFFTSYFVILITKLVFITYLEEQFIQFTLEELIYSIFWGIKFDFAASAIIAFLVTLFDFNKKTFALSSAIGIITIFLTQISNIFYFEESSRHIGYEIKDMFEDAGSLFMTAFSQNTIMTVSAIVISLFIFITIYKLFQKIEASKINKFYFLKKLFIIALTIFFIRGMFQGIPLHPWQANEIGNTQLANVSLNSIYNIAYSLVNHKKQLSQKKLPHISEEQIQISLDEIYSDTKNVQIDLPLIKTKPNIIFLFSESWSAKFMNTYGFAHKTTPVYDELLQISLHPKFMLANGHRTTEGIFATLTSFQNPLGKSVAKSQLQSYKYDSIIKELTKIGYQSAFFQGSNKDTSGTGSLVNSLGFVESYGKDDIKEKIYEENYWGVQDTDLYNFIENKIYNKELKEPFVLGINGATTHDSITPTGYKRHEFSKNEKINNKLNALHYSDYAMGEFIKKIEKDYPNTIFILFADHCGGYLSGNMENYMIPFAIYSKDLIAPKKLDTVLSQRDIAPTVYDLVIGNYNKEMKNFSGKSIISNNKFYADYFRNGTLGWIENKDIIELNTATNKLECFKLVDFGKESLECNSNHFKMKEKVLSLSTKSQELLFSGNTKEFKEYK